MKIDQSEKIFTKGDVLKGALRGRDAARHFIVFLEGHNIDYFIGAVITHSSNFFDNILMAKEHFEEASEDGNPYKLSFDKTYLVSKKFLKLESWGPFKKIGRLTQKGVDFVDSVIKESEPIFWDDYIKRIKYYGK